MYTKLDNDIIGSSIWSEDSDTRVVWITLMAMSDFEGKVQASIPGLARIANVSIQSCQKAIDTFLKPDPYSRCKDFEGRRIEETDGGWMLLSKAKYRDKDYSRAEYYRAYRQKRNSCATPTQQTTTHKEEKKDKDKVNNYSAEFLSFWTVYPNKTKKGEAWKAWKVIKPSGELIALMIKAVQEHSKSEQWTKESGRFIPHPATWLRASQWEDEGIGTVGNICCVCNNPATDAWSMKEGKKVFYCGHHDPKRINEDGTMF